MEHLDDQMEIREETEEYEYYPICPYCGSVDFVEWDSDDDDGDVWECGACLKTFTDSESEANALTSYSDDAIDNEYDAFMRRMEVQSPNSNQPSLFTGLTTQYKVCTHTPFHAITGGKDTKWGVWVGKRYDVLKSLDDFDVILNCTGWSVLSEKHRIPIKELKKYEGTETADAKYAEIVLDWPDMGVTDLPKAWWVDLGEYLKKKDYKMLIFCVGGHGRTGTALASMLVCCLGYGAQEAINWVRDNYCDECIESLSQENYIGKFDPKWVKKEPPPPKVVTSTSGKCVHGKLWSEACDKCVSTRGASTQSSTWGSERCEHNKSMQENCDECNAEIMKGVSKGGFSQTAESYKSNNPEDLRVPCPHEFMDRNACEICAFEPNDDTLCQNCSKKKLFHWHDSPKKGDIRCMDDKDFVPVKPDKRKKTYDIEVCKHCGKTEKNHWVITNSDPKLNKTTCAINGVVEFEPLYKKCDIHTSVRWMSAGPCPLCETKNREVQNA